MPPISAWIMLYYNVHFVNQYGEHQYVSQFTSLMSARSAIRTYLPYPDVVLYSRLYPYSYRRDLRSRRSVLERWTNRKQVWVSPDWDDIQQATVAYLSESFNRPSSGLIRAQLQAELSQKECK